MDEVQVDLTDQKVIMIRKSDWLNEFGGSI